MLQARLMSPKRQNLLIFINNSLGVFVDPGLISN